MIDRATNKRNITITKNPTYIVFMETKQHLCYLYYIFNFNRLRKQGKFAYVDYYIPI